MSAEYYVSETPSGRGAGRVYRRPRAGMYRLTIETLLGII